MERPTRLADLPQAPKRPVVAIVGAGFGGLHVGLRLRDVAADVVLVDRRNYHLFQPLLYQVASAVLSPADIAQATRKIFRSYRNVRVVLGEVESVSLGSRTLTVSGASLHYDYLVLAAGATHSYFGHDEWATHAPGLKTVEDALEIRRRILLTFEAAELEGDDEARRQLLTFVIVGGGPTGVELAGALKEIATRTVLPDFRAVDTSTTRVILVEGQSRVLPGMSERASVLALRDLRAAGVEVRLGSFVTALDETSVYVGEERIDAANVFWAAGVRASKLGESLGVELDRAGRVLVEPDCSIPGYPESFAIGDMAALSDTATGRPIPGVAQAAMQMGDYVGDQIRREVSRDRGPAAMHHLRPPFRYKDKGSMATIGRAAAVADISGRTLGGLLAWLIWCFVHVMFLIDFRNRLSVMLSWAYNYLAFSKGARLITGPATPRLKQPRT